jgi:hypothetical protein
MGLMQFWSVKIFQQFSSIFGSPQNVNCWFLFEQSYMFASQLVNLPWHPCKSVLRQAFDLQFALQVH